MLKNGHHLSVVVKCLDHLVGDPSMKIGMNSLHGSLAKRTVPATRNVNFPPPDGHLLNPQRSLFSYINIVVVVVVVVFSKEDLVSFYFICFR